MKDETIYRVLKWKKEMVDVWACRLPKEKDLFSLQLKPTKGYVKYNINKDSKFDSVNAVLFYPYSKLELKFPINITELYIYKNKEECVKKYNELVQNKINKLQKEIDKWKGDLINEKSNI